MSYLEFTEYMMNGPLPTITIAQSVHSKGESRDFYSNGDYWWPNPDTPDGLPYVRRDGESNPNNFNAHRFILRQTMDWIVTLYRKFKATGDRMYSDRISDILKCFFLDEETGMNPSLNYAQSIPGVCAGRGIGIVDTVHLVDIPFIVDDLKNSNVLNIDVFIGMSKWFNDFSHWLRESQLGIDESNEKNNHSIAYYMQLASFSWLAQNRHQIYKMIADVLMTRIIPLQVADNGSMPLELARTKPYNYSCFALDIMVTLTSILSNEMPEIVDFRCGTKSPRKALDFMYPYLVDKKKWPYGNDIENFDNLPVRMAFMYLAYSKFDMLEYKYLWDKLGYPKDVSCESARNCAAKCPEVY